jgi:hypothetical protein
MAEKLKLVEFLLESARGTCIRSIIKHQHNNPISWQLV